MQQLKIIKHFVKKNHSKTKVVECKTVREKNGIPYSSRNFLLSVKEKKIASKIYNLLLSKKKNISKSKKNLINISKQILSLGAKKIDYLDILDINKVIKPYTKNNKYKIFIAYYLGATRLIDNI